MGPMSQLKKMFQATRLIATVVMLVIIIDILRVINLNLNQNFIIKLSIVMTLVSAIVVR
jgi:hypothetical protein